jgi:hypothetical protein
VKRANANRIVVGDYFAMNSVHLRLDANVRTNLSDGNVTKTAKRPDQFAAGNIARQLHSAMTVSRTK